MSRPPGRGVAGGVEPEADAEGVALAIERVVDAQADGEGILDAGRVAGAVPQRRNGAMSLAISWSMLM